MNFENNPQDLMGRTVYGSDGQKIGTAVTGVPRRREQDVTEWAHRQHRSVRHQGDLHSGDAELTSRGDRQVNGGLKGQGDCQGGAERRTSPADTYARGRGVRKLYPRYYEAWDVDSYSNWQGTSTANVDHRDDTVPRAYDTSGPTTDDAMTVSEERLRVGTEQTQAGN